MRQFIAHLFEEDKNLHATFKTAGNLDVETRLGVYRNNIISSLIDSLSDTYPVTRQLVGDAFFEAMAFDYISINKPSSPTLYLYGEEFSAYIGDHQATQYLPFLPDVAKLEWGLLQSMHSQNSTDLQSTSTPHIYPIPSARWIRSNFPILSILNAHQSQETPDLRDIDLSSKEAVLIHRPDLKVHTTLIQPETAELLDKIKHGMPLVGAVGISQNKQLLPLVSLLKMGALFII